MIKNYTVKWVIFFFVSFTLFGCTSLSSSLSRQDEMKVQTANYQLPKLPENGKALVYVVRPSIDCKPFSFSVFIDNQKPESEMGSTKGTQYICFDLTPGEHKILSKVEKWDTWAEINVLAKAGDIIFIEQEPDMGFITLNHKLLTLQDYEGKYYIKTLTKGTFSSNNKTSVATTSTQARPAQNVRTDTYKGIIEKCRFVKPFGFRWIINFKMEVKADNGSTDIFYIWRTSQLVGSDGRNISFDDISGKINGKRVEIEHFIIEDDKGGYSDGSGFSYEVGQKGVRVLRLLD